MQFHPNLYMTSRGKVTILHLLNYTDAVIAMLRIQRLLKGLGEGSVQGVGCRGQVIRRMQELVFSPCCSGTEERSYKHFCVAQLSRNGIPRTRRVRGATQKCIFDVNGIGKRPV